MTTAIEAKNLTDLAEQINESHRQCEETAKSAVEHAMRAGELLIEAKGQCKSGTWTEWVRANCDFALRTAQLYMRVAREIPQLPEPEAQRVAHLPIRAVTQQLNKEHRRRLRQAKREAIEREADDAKNREKAERHEFQCEYPFEWLVQIGPNEACERRDDLHEDLKRTPEFESRQAEIGAMRERCEALSLELNELHSQIVAAEDQLENDLETEVTKQYGVPLYYRQSFGVKDDLHEDLLHSVNDDDRAEWLLEGDDWVKWCVCPPDQRSVVCVRGDGATEPDGPNVDAWSWEYLCESEWAKADEATCELRKQKVQEIEEAIERALVATDEPGLSETGEGPGHSLHTVADTTGGDEHASEGRDILPLVEDVA
ncbi:MAG: DUF3102 domain-containing protein [Planctomycetota bacterium]|jgi:hypothetical protein